MGVKIVLPEPYVKGRAQSAAGTRVFNHEGAEIENITSMDIRIRPGEIIEAKINVAISCDTELDNIHALLGTETLEQIAVLHGKSLYPVKGSHMATIGFKVGCSQIEGVQSTLDILAKYADELPQAMKDELAEIIKEK